MKENKAGKFNILSCVVILLVLAACVYFGCRKSGFYIDEYYQFTIANGTQLGISIMPGQWNETKEYKSQLVSEGEENFRFSQVNDTAANDVHPPLYYYIIHFVSSVFSGTFSKWLGLSVNILLMIPALMIVRKIAYMLSDGNETVTLVTMLFFGLAPSTISMVVLIRMYLLLALWTLLFVYLHLKDLERDTLSVGKFLIPVFITGFLGFLTQYFFVIIMFFITLLYGAYLMFIRRRIKDAFIYGGTVLASLVCTHFVWPYSYFHIFQGYRGQGAFAQMMDFAGMWQRVVTQLSWMNKMVFGGLLFVFVIVLALGSVLIVRRCRMIRKEGGSPIKDLPVSVKGFILVAGAAILNIAALSQVALTERGITCCRQVYDSYALFLVLIPVGLYRLLGSIGSTVGKRAVMITAVAAAAVLISGYAQKTVLYLYEDEAVLLDYAKEHPDAKVVMFENDDGGYDSRLMELMMYPKVYYVSVSDISAAEDPVIAGADELLVYVSKDADSKQCFDSIYEQNPKVTKADLMAQCYDFFDVYMMH